MHSLAFSCSSSEGPHLLRSVTLTSSAPSQILGAVFVWEPKIECFFLQPSLQGQNQLLFRYCKSWVLKSWSYTTVSNYRKSAQWLSCIAGFTELQNQNEPGWKIPLRSSSTVYDLTPHQLNHGTDCHVQYLLSARKTHLLILNGWGKTIW